MKSDSHLSNRIFSEYYIHMGEFESAVEMSRVGLNLLAKLEADFGLSLIW